jgi:hypothetical protein
LQQHHSSPFVASGVHPSQAQVVSASIPADNHNTSLGQSQGSLKPGGTSVVTFAVPADPLGHSSTSASTTTPSNNQHGDQGRSNGANSAMASGAATRSPPRHERSPSPSAPAGHTDSTVVHSSPFAHTGLVAPGGGMSSGLTLPRAGIWLLMGSSVLKRCACSVALNVATLAEARLGGGGGAVERWAAGKSA